MFFKFDIFFTGKFVLPVDHRKHFFKQNISAHIDFSIATLSFSMLYCIVINTKNFLKKNNLPSNSKQSPILLLFEMYVQSETSFTRSLRCGHRGQLGPCRSDASKQRIESG